MSTELSLQDPKQSEISIAAKKITDGLVAFEKRKSELTELKKEADGLKIESLEDRETINMVSTVRKKLKSARVEIEKEGKSMRDPLTAINRDISARENELIDIIEPTEKALLVQEKWVKDEQQKLDQEEERKEQARIQGRINRLAEYGFEIDLTLLKGVSDEQFEETVESARKEWQKEQDAIAEKERQDQVAREQAERDRLELKALREKQEEADRILKERQDELYRQEQAIKEQQEAAKKAEEFRLKKEQAEKERLEYMEEVRIKAIDKARFDSLKEIGFTYPFADLGTMPDATYKDLFDEHNKVWQKKLHEKWVADKKEEQRLAELKKQEELVAAGDKAVWADFISKLKALPVYKMNSPQYRRMAAISVKKLIEIYDLKP